MNTEKCHTEDALEERKHNYQVYLDERKSLSDAIKETSQQFDKAILTLAAGALALSLTYTRDIVQTLKPWTLGMLYSSWIAFTSSILSTLISFFASQKTCYRQIEIMQEEFIEEKPTETDKENPYKKWTVRLNIISISLFVLGVIFLIIFSSVNLSTRMEEAMSAKKAIIKPILPDAGYVPPSQPIKQAPQTPPVKKGS